MQDVVLIVEPHIHIEMLAGILNGTLDANPVTKVDAARTIKSKPERFLAVLQQFIDPSSDTGVARSLAGHLSYTALLLADKDDVADCIHTFSGMELCEHPTKSDDHSLLIVTGSVKQWMLALANSMATPSVRQLLSLLRNQFISAGLARLFNDEQLKLLK